MIVYLGYIASFFLACSLLVTQALKFRWLNILGNLFFITYGVLILAWPVILANGILLAINIYQLFRLYLSKESFEMLPFEKEGVLLQKFVEFYKKDIADYFPDFAFNQDSSKVSFVVIRDLVVANLFVAKLHPDGNAIVEINYTVAKYRDYKTGRFIFEREKEHLLERGVKKIVYEKMNNKNHLHFLKVMGFEKQEIQGKSCLVKSLT